MEIIATSQSIETAEDHFRRAFHFYAACGHHLSAIAQLTAGLLVMAQQLTSIERALSDAKKR